MIKINNLWDVIKRITIVVSIIINTTVIVFVLIILTHKVSINIDGNGEATTTNDVPLKMPISFDMGAIKIKGDASVVIPKETLLPVKIKMVIPLLDAISIKNIKQTDSSNDKNTKDTESKNIKDTKQTDPNKSDKETKPTEIKKG
jgi:hypothetical protein